ncbi:hypothetical protein ACP4OV_020485 [Aristida adscensionis]
MTYRSTRTRQRRRTVDSGGSIHRRGGESHLWHDGAVPAGAAPPAIAHLPHARDDPRMADTMHVDNDPEVAVLRLGYVKPEVLSWTPRIILFHNFLSSEECDYLMAIARPRLRVSSILDAATGKGVISDFRTSYGMFVNPGERNCLVIQAIEKRISMFSQIPQENGEPMQVLRYEPGQYYRPHHDYFYDVFSLQYGGQRVATMLMYLTNGVEGGETHFPQAGEGECSCGGRMVRGLCIKPNKGDAVLFWSTGLDGNTDPNSIHSGCPVLKGEKWSATKWMRQNKTSLL